MKKIITTIILAALYSIVVTANAADGVELQATVVTSAPVKITKPFRDLAKPLPVLTKERKLKMTASGEIIPGYGKVREIPNRFPFKNRDYKLPEGFVDTAAQTSLKKNANQALAPTLGVSFDGVGNVMGVAPPDTNGDVGPDHYVQTVNLAMAVWDKQGNQLMAPTATNALWAGFGGLCESNNNGDPIVLYDGAADRWMISQFALSGTNNHECIAISTTADPTGSYFLYDFAYGALMNDYPHLGVWTDGYYMGVNQFDPANNFSFEGGGVVAYERDKMLVGAVAQQVKFDMNNSSPTVFTPMPLDIDGALAPPAGSNQYFIWSDLDTRDNLQVWEFDIDWANPGAATFTPVTAIAVTPYGSAPAITQPNGSSLDSLSIRSMFRAAYRNLDGQGKIVFTHNIAAPPGQGQTALRWYEIDVNQVAGTATLVQESTFAPDTESRWMGSGAMDVNGNMAFGYSIASATMAPSIATATRLAMDPLNTLTDETMLVVGGGSQSGTSRWGDYSSMSVDPVDECTFWFTSEYYKEADDGSLAWSTNISSFKIPTCVLGPRGEIAGAVTDSDSGDPIPFASVTAGIGSTVADANGDYIITLPVGLYEVSAFKYGWVASTAVSVTVAEDETITSDIALDGATPVLVSGTVADGGGAGHNLYAKISVRVPGDTLTTFTNPETGAYSVNLFEGATVNISVSEIIIGGYLDTDMDILPVDGMPDVDFALAINANCTAPGYDFVLPAFFEGFDTWPAAGWTVTQDATGTNSHGLWNSYLTSGKNLAVIETDAALADSDDAGPGSSTDTSLVSPVINVADLDSLILEFDALFRPLGLSASTIDVSTDGAVTWVNVGSVDTTNTYDPYTIDLTGNLTAATSFQIRFRYTSGWDWWTLVDNVRFGNRICQPTIVGALTTGYVIDTNTTDSLVGATVSVDGTLEAISLTTTEDDALNDGLFQVFIPASATNIEVAKDMYETAAPTVGDITLATPVSLNAGQLTAEPESVATTITAGRSDSTVLTVTNTGSADTDFSPFILKGDSTALINGPFHPSNRHFGPKDLNDLDTKKIRHFPESNVAELASGSIIDSFPTDITYGWGISRDRETGEFWIGDLLAAGAAADVIWKYEADGTLTADSIPVTWGGAAFHADTAFNQRTGMLWSVDVAGDNCIHEVDTVALVATGNTICPTFGVSQRGLAYDPVTNTFYSGSWNDGIIHQFTIEGELIRSVNIGQSIAGLAYNPETKHLFVSNSGSSADPAVFDIVVVDTSTPALDGIGGFNVRGDLNGDGILENVTSSVAGLDIDCDGNLWMVDQNLQEVFGFESGETGVCEWNNVPWLTASLADDSLEIGASNTVTLNFDSTGMDTGDYTASIIYENNAPYGALDVPVTMTVAEPAYGELGFVVTSVEVNENATATITVARTAGADFAVSVDYMTVNGTAFSGQHFTAASGTLSWADMDTDSKTFTVDTSQLLDIHQDLTFAVHLMNAQGGASIASASQSIDVTIVDLANGELQFDVTNVEVNEGDSVTLTVERTDGANFEVNVDYATVDGSAVAASDYTATSGTLTWADQDTGSKTITVSTSALDAHKSFSVALSNPQGGAELGAKISATVTIEDQPKGGGSLGIPLLMLFALAGLLRRRQVVAK